MPKPRPQTALIYWVELFRKDVSKAGGFRVEMRHAQALAKEFLEMWPYSSMRVEIRACRLHRRPTSADVCDILNLTDGDWDGYSVSMAAQI